MLVLVLYLLIFAGKQRALGCSKKVWNMVPNQVPGSVIDTPPILEPNFEMYPFFLVSSGKAGYGGRYGYQSSMEYETTSGQESLEQAWMVYPSELGAPRGTDQDVYMAVNELLYRYGGMPEDNTLYFTFAEMLQILGWEYSGKMRRRLRESLKRISHARIEAQDSFWSERRQSYLSKTFGLWSVSLSAYRQGDGVLHEKHRLVFDQLFAESWRDSYQPGMDLSYYWTLDKQVSRRLYRLLDCRCSASGSGRRASRSWQVQLQELRDLMPLATGYNQAQVMRVLYSAHEELQNKGFLSKVETYQPQGRRGPTILRYEVSSKFDKRRISSDTQQDPVKAAAIQKMLAVTANLKKGRLNRDKALELVDSYGADVCLHYAGILPEKNPDSPGLLIKAIENSWDWQHSSSDNSLQGSVTSPAEQRGPTTDNTSSGDCVDRSGVGHEFLGGDQPARHSEAASSTPPAATQDDTRDGDGQSKVAQASGVNRETERKPVERALADKFYQESLDKLSSESPTTNVERWFEEIYALSLDGGALTLSVPSEQAREYIAGRFKEEMESYLVEILEARGYTGDVELRLVVGEGG